MNRLKKRKKKKEYSTDFTLMENVNIRKVCKATNYQHKSGSLLYAYISYKITGTVIAVVLQWFLLMSISH